MSEVKRLENSVVEVVYSVEENAWKEATKKAFNALNAKLKVSGFREGKVPPAIAKKHISDQDVMQKAIDMVAQKGLEEVIKEHELHIIARPMLGIESVSMEACTLKYTLEIYPEIEIKEYKNLGIKKSRVVVTQKEIDESIEQVLSQEAMLELKDENATVEKGDTAVIDFEGFLEGVAFEGGKGENHPLEIGSNSFIPGFEEQLIGMKSEETKDIQVTFPKEYHAENLAGKEVTFKVTVHEIKAKILPEFNDEWVSEQEIENVANVEDYKKYVKGNIKEQKQAKVEEEFFVEILNKIKENATMPIPDSMIQDEISDMMNQFQQRLAQQGMNLEMYQQFTGQDEAALRGQMSKDAKLRVENRLVLDKVAQLESITIAEEVVEEEYKKIAEVYNESVENLKKRVPAGAIAYEMKLQKAIEFLKENAE